MARVPLLLSFVLFCLVMPAASAALALATGGPGGDNLLSNGGFESGSASWLVLDGSLSPVEAPVYEGSRAARIATVGASAGRATQAVSLVPGQEYQLSGRALVDTNDVQSLLLRITWQDSNGTTLTRDSAPLAGTGSEYQPLSTAALQLPCDATNARVWVLLQPAPSAPDAHAYIDDLRLTGSTGGTACAPPGRTPSGTPGPAPTRTPPTTEDASPTPSHGLLVNGGFESVDAEGSLVAWRKQGGLLAQVIRPVRAGSAAAGFVSNTTSTKWLYQTVPVTPGEWYEAAAYIYDDTPWVESAWLRISWYESGDASGGALDDVDSTAELIDPVGAYRQLSTGSVQAPPSAHSASVRVMLRPRDATSALIYVDEVTFVPTSAPAVPPGEAASRNRGERLGSVRGPGAADSRVSDVLGAGRRPGPTPLIQRRESEQAQASAARGAGFWWPWLLLGGVLVAGAAAWLLRDVARRWVTTKTRSRGTGS